MENYEILGLIGKGNFGSISKIKRNLDNRILVWKELDYGKMTEKEKQHIVAEVNILRELKHPNIVRYYDRIIDKRNTKIYIVMEYCEGGDIGALIKRCKKTSEYIAEDVIWKIFTQLVLALHECHTRKEGKILHRDLKPSNVFLDKENNVKLGDFGLSRVLSTESTFAYSHVGTPYYMSPEQIDEDKYNEKSDIWSLGCFLYELTTFNPPFEATNHLSLAIKIKNGKVERINSRYSEELNRVINWMLLVDQDKRPLIEDLLNLPQVSLRLRERRLKDTMSKFKKIEENLKQKEIELEQRENELKEKEKGIFERENLILKKEQDLKEMIIKFQIEKENKKINSKNNSNVNEISVNFEEKHYSSDKYSLPLQIPICPKTNFNSYNNKEYETIADSINSQINQTSVNLNYLSLLNNKDNININYNINNKIKFENNYEMFSERTKSNIDNKASISEKTTRDTNKTEVNKSKENFITNHNNGFYNKDFTTPTSSKNYGKLEYINNFRNLKRDQDKIDNKNSESNSSKQNSFNNNNETNLQYFTEDNAKLDSKSKMIHNRNLNQYQDNKDHSSTGETNFNFDPSLYREQRDTKYATANNIQSLNYNMMKEEFSTPFKKNSINSLNSLSGLNSINPINSISHLQPTQKYNESRDNFPNINNNGNNNLIRPLNKILTSSPVINQTKSFLSNKNLKYISQGADNISTVTSTPQISNRLSNHTMSSNIKISLINQNVNSNLNSNHNANINKYSSILTRDRSFSPSAATTNNYIRKNSKPPLGVFK